jgi:hypothetical protein
MIYIRPLDEADNHQTKQRFIFTMTKFAKVTKAFSNMIGYLITLTVVLTYLFCFVKLPPNQPDINGKPIKITCNEYDKINYPMKSSNPREKYSVCFLLGTCFCCVSLLTSGILLAKKRFNSFSSSNRSAGILLVLFQLLLWIVALITGGVFVWLWVNNGPTETLAPNFLAACKPNGLDVLCSPDNHLDGNPVVWVTC